MKTEIAPAFVGAAEIMDNSYIVFGILAAVVLALLLGARRDFALVAFGVAVIGAILTTNIGT